MRLCALESLLRLDRLALPVLPLVTEALEDADPDVRLNALRAQTVIATSYSIERMAS